MSTSYMLDTNMLGYIVRGRSMTACSRFLHLTEHETACISSITEAEILYGLAKCPAATRLRTLMEELLRKIEVLPFDSEAALHYGTMRAGLEAKGTSLENMDMLIAAHAAAVNAVLVTNDKAFRRVDGLIVDMNWATDLKTY